MTALRSSRDEVRATPHHVRTRGAGRPGGGLAKNGTGQLFDPGLSSLQAPCFCEVGSIAARLMGQQTEAQRGAAAKVVRSCS